MSVSAVLRSFAAAFLPTFILLRLLRDIMPPPVYLGRRRYAEREPCELQELINLAGDDEIDYVWSEHTVPADVDVTPDVVFRAFARVGDSRRAGERIVRIRAFVPLSRK